MPHQSAYRCILDDLDHTANYLFMLFGEEPEPERVRALETYLNTVVDHGLNSSTFTARVITSTGSDLVSAVVGAISVLKGTTARRRARARVGRGL